MTTRDGGQAFPRLKGLDKDDFGERWHAVISDGMSLRDYFAGQALAGMLASEGVGTPDGPTTWGGPEDMAAHAYRLADAMLAARGNEA